jgi:hypothetical protein
VNKDGPRFAVPVLPFGTSDTNSEEDDTAGFAVATLGSAARTVGGDVGEGLGPKGFTNGV